MDFIFIRELRLEVWIGLHRHEKIAPQAIEMDIEFGIPGSTVFTSDKVGDTIDYAVVVEHIRALVATERFGLVETLAHRIANMILADFNAPRAKVRIAKLGMLRNAGHVGVCVERERPA